MSFAISLFVYRSPKKHILVPRFLTNCKGQHTINTVNVGSTRDLISQNEMYKAKDCKADTTCKAF